ncbi:MAG: class I SAM-dependent methyltransferase [Methanothrix sp.]|nr:class I SAM-dependent methyltransferase [Methanothrix sp.]MCX8206229.1 class I SAM-dependent methyltransferase [Methanothrix sp.]
MASQLHEMMRPANPDLSDPAMPSNASASPIRSPGVCRSAPERHAEPNCTNLRDSWDQFYLRSGRSWGGITRDIPELPCGSRVLELGCGSGKTLRGMVGRGWRIVAIDVSPGALRLSRSIKENLFFTFDKRGDIGNPSSKELHGDLEFIAADGRHLPFRDEAFDAVFAFHVVGHLVRPQRSVMAGEIIRVTRKGGMVFFRGFSFDDLRAGGEEIEEGTFIRGDGTVTHYFTEDEVLDLFKPLLNISVDIVRWSMRVGGLDLIRSEMRAAFRKE